MNVYNFEEVTNYNYHFLVGDSIRSVKRDLYFSLGSRYYCDAGCKVCYIGNNLNKLKSTADNYFQPITIQREESWEEVFAYFEYLRMDDDIYYLKEKHPSHYEWIRRNAHRFEYGITDNAIFRYMKMMPKVKFAGLSSVSLSSFFVERVQHSKLYYALEKFVDTIGIQQLKFIHTDNVDILKPFAEWAHNLNIEVLHHYDFTKKREVLDIDWIQDQVTWIDTDEDGTMQVYGDEATQLYFDRFYFSNELSSNLNEEAYSYLEDHFDPEAFLVDMARGKQRLYNIWKDRAPTQKFADYYNATLQYEFYYDYNFIPSNMLPPYSLYCKKLIENGWQITKHGLYKDDGRELKPLVKKVR